MSGDGVDRPGGWVPGIGWVALLSEVPEGTSVNTDAINPTTVRIVGTRTLAMPVIVTRWPDGEIPAALAVIPEAPAACETRDLIDRAREIITIPDARYWRRLMALHELLGTEAPPRSSRDRDSERIAHGRIDALLAAAPALPEADSAATQHTCRPGVIGSAYGCAACGLRPEGVV